MASLYTIHPPAYHKPLLHAAKYPSCTVLGLLIGTSQPLEGGSGHKVEVEDAVLVLHHWTGLGMAAEAALGMADVHAKTKGKKLVGVYSADANLEGKGLSRTATQMLEAVRRAGCPEALGLVIDNERLASEEPVFIPFTTSSAPSSSSSTWSPHPHVLPALPTSSSSSSTSPTFVLSSPSLPTKALSAIREGKYKDVGDFDDHLEDLGADWLENASAMVGLVNKDLAKVAF